MKKSFVLLSVLLLLGLVTAACSSDKNSSNNTNTKSESKTAAVNNDAEKLDVTLTYLASQGWIMDAEIELAKKFEEETGIRIDYQIIPAGQYNNVIKTRLNAGEGPDIFGGQSGHSELTSNFNVAENAVDLSNEEWVNRKEPLSVDHVTVDGKVYALTIWDTSNSFVINYNKRIFEDLGLDIPATYEEFKEIGLTLLDAGITPLYEPFAEGWHHVLWFAEPGPRFEQLEPGLYDALNENKVTFAENDTIRTLLDQFQEMFELGFFGSSALANTQSDAPRNLADGDYAMMLHGQDMPSLVEEYGGQYKADDFGFFVIPLLDNQIYYMHPGGPSKFIYSRSEHIDLAKRYFDFLTRSENLQYYIDNEPNFSGINFKDDALQFEYSAAQEEMFERFPERGINLQNYVNYVNPQWMEMGKDIVSMVSGVLEPVGVLDNIDRRRAEMAEIASDPNW